MYPRIFSFITTTCLLLALVHAQACPAIPDLTSYNNTALPDPFTFANGNKVVTLEDWACRRAEISTLMQMDELGVLPDDPDLTVASFTGNTLTINVTDGGKSISFAPTITFPSGRAPAAGWPAIIGMGGISIPRPSSVAIINFNNEQMANQDSNPASRGVGLFFNLYGSDASAGAMIAWAWAVRRIMDALEMTPSAKINTARVGVSGCSRNGKGALVAGAFEPRLALTIPQESGSGGTDSWRISDFILASGILTQTASELHTENVWMSPNFDVCIPLGVSLLTDLGTRRSPPLRLIVCLLTIICSARWWLLAPCS